MNIDLLKMVVEASTLGWTVPLPVSDWPESFERDGKTWQKDAMTVAENIGEVVCVDYAASDGTWLIVSNE